MDIKDQVVDVLSRHLGAEYVRLEDDDGITGFVVSPVFRGMDSLDRQGRIEDALGRAALSPADRRRVLMIAGLTPEEYESVGPRVRVHRVRERDGGALEIVLHGSLSDAEYVRGALRNQRGVRTTEPEQVSGAVGILMAFRASGSGKNPLSRERALQILRKDPYIEVMANA